MFGLSPIDLPVTDLARALGLYAGVLNVPEKARGEGCADLAAGGCTVRLALTRKPEHLGAIRVQSPAVEDATSAMLRRGARLVQRAVRTPEQTRLAAVRDPDGNPRLLGRPRSADEDERAPDESSREVTREEVVRSFILASPRITRARNRQPLIDQGVDVARYQADGDAD